MASRGQHLHHGGQAQAGNDDRERGPHRRRPTALADPRPPAQPAPRASQKPVDVLAASAATSSSHHRAALASHAGSAPPTAPIVTSDRPTIRPGAKTKRRARKRSPFREYPAASQPPTRGKSAISRLL